MSAIGLTSKDRNVLKQRMKFASTALRIRALQQEIAKYNLPSLQKAAAVGANKVQRLKLAALHRQCALERSEAARIMAKLLMS